METKSNTSLYKRLSCILDKYISILIFKSCLHLAMFLFKIVDKMEVEMKRKKFIEENKYNEKYDSLTKFFMLIAIPKNTLVTYQELKRIYPTLSKNKIYELINMKKDIEHIKTLVSVKPEFNEHSKYLSKYNDFMSNS